jgi:hypothetical protein
MIMNFLRKTPTLLAIGITAAISLYEAPALAFSLNQNNNSTELLNNLLGNTSGLSNFKVKLTGDARAFGTFQDDPFGLMSGIVLSTGQVSELKGKNIADGGFSPATSTTLQFNKLPGLTGGSPAGTAVYYADLSNLGFELNSLTIADSGNGEGGTGGVFSGFDLDAIKFSNTLITSAADIANLPSLNVFDFSPAKTVFTPGTQRSSTGTEPSGPDLFGTINDNINNAVATLENFDANSTTGSEAAGFFSLGDGGKVGFNLTSPIATIGNPLYLYLGEVGDNGEVASGQITVSNRFISGLNDLSTDFGQSGPTNDSISMQIDFTADEIADKLFFQYVFGSEEFVEYGGKVNDSFSLTLNGFNLARLSDGASVTINNLVPSPFGPYHPDFIYNPVSTGPTSNQTKLDGYTKPLTFEGSLKKNAKNTLVLTVKDVNDGQLDSAVLIKGGTLGTKRPPDIIPGGGNGNTTIPEPSSGLGILAFGALGTGLILKKYRNRKSCL